MLSDSIYTICAVKIKSKKAPVSCYNRSFRKEPPIGSPKQGIKNWGNDSTIDVQSLEGSGNKPL